MKTKLISFAIPAYNETEIMDELIARMTGVADSLKEKYDVEIILVDDGSSDNTWELIVGAGKNDPRFKGVKLAGNVGQQLALMCGYRHTKGDAVVTIDADMQDPPEISLQLIEEWEKGAEIVFAVRTKRDGEPPWRLALINLYYYLRSKIIKTYLPGNSGEFRLVDRKVVDVLNSLTEKNTYIRGIIGKIGFKRSAVYYNRKPRCAGEGKYPLHKLIKLGADGIFSMSSAPLLLAYVFAIVMTIIFAAYVIFAFIYSATQNIAVPWFDMALAFIIYSFAFMLFCFLGILGEYVGRIYDEAKNRPPYIVDKTINI